MFTVYRRGDPGHQVLQMLSEVRIIRPPVVSGGAVRQIALALFLLSTSFAAALGCTGVVLTSVDTTIAAGNEDWLRLDSYLWAEAPTERSFGVVFLGFEVRGEWGHPFDFWYEFHGINDQGLFFDSFGAPCVMPLTTLRNPNRGEHLMAQAMRTCATVEQAVALFESSHLAFMQCQQFLFVDRGGNAAVVEGDRTVWMDGATLAVTNFYLSDPSLGGYPCWRYERVMDMLRQDASATCERAAHLLEAASHPATRYSVVVDLVRGRGDLYYNHDFSRPISVDLFALAAAGCERMPVQDVLAGEDETISEFLWQD